VKFFKDIRRERSWLLITVFFALLTFGYNYNQVPDVGLFNDDAYYILAARHFAGVDANYFGEFKSRALGFAVLLSPWTKIFPNAIQSFKIPVVLFYIGAVFLLFFVFRDEISYFFIFLLSFVFITSFAVIINGLAIFPQGAYLFFVLLFLYFFRKKMGQSLNFSLKKVVFFAFLNFWLVFIRPEGFIWFLLTVVFFLKERKWKAALYFSFFFSAFSILVLYRNSPFCAGTEKYISEWGFAVFQTDLLKIVYENLIFYISALSRGFVFFYNLNSLAFPLGVFCLLIIIYGFAKIKEKSQIWFLIKWGTLFHFILLLIWPAKDFRFLIPAAPFFIFYFLKGLESLNKKLFIFLLFVMVATHLYNIFHKKPSFRISRETFDFINKSTEVEDMFSSELNYTIALFTGRKSIPLQGQPTIDEFVSALIKKQVDYIVLFNRVGQTEYKNIPTEAQLAKVRNRTFVGEKEIFVPIYVNEKEQTVVFRMDKLYKKSFEKAFLLYRKGVEKIKQGKWKAAKKILEKAVDVNPKIPFLCNALAFVYAEEGNFKKAEAVLLTCISSVKTNPFVYISLGEICERMKDTKRAKSFYQKALKISEKLFFKEAYNLALQKLKFMRI